MTGDPLDPGAETEKLSVRQWPIPAAKHVFGHKKTDRITLIHNNIIEIKDHFQQTIS